MEVSPLFSNAVLHSLGHAISQVCSAQYKLEWCTDAAMQISFIAIVLKHRQDVASCKRHSVMALPTNEPSILKMVVKCPKHQNVQELYAGYIAQEREDALTSTRSGT
jgi:hypothetical protein